MNTRRRFLGALVAGVASYAATPAVIGAHPYVFETSASVYGPQFYWEGNATADGTRFDTHHGPQLVSVAHRTLPLGSHITVEIPPQPDAWGHSVARHGALVPCVVHDRGPYRWGPRGQLLPFPGRDVDLTMGLLRLIGFFDPSIVAFFGPQSEYTEAVRWGVRHIRVHVHG